MIIIAGTITFNPDLRDAAIAAVTELETITRQEPGNLDYGFWESHSDPGVFLVFERWEDEAAIQTHSNSEHMAAFLGKAGEIGITGASIDRFDVSAVAKFM